MSEIGLFSRTISSAQAASPAVPIPVFFGMLLVALVLFRQDFFATLLAFLQPTYPPISGVADEELLAGNRPHLSVPIS